MALALIRIFLWCLPMAVLTGAVILRFMGLLP